MSQQAHPPGLHGQRLLILAHSSIDTERFRRLNHVEIVVVRRRSDRSFDPRIDGEFTRAIVVGCPPDPLEIAAAVSYAGPRLRVPRLLGFVAPMEDGEHMRTLLQTALPGESATRGTLGPSSPEIVLTVELGDPPAPRPVATKTRWRRGLKRPKT